MPGIPHRYTSKGFAQGWRRWLDWPDWIHPKAWVYEHNVLHHRFTGEADDPNMVDAHTEYLRTLPIPRALKYLGLVGVAMVWKVVYYTPGTFITLNAEALTRKPMGTIDRLNLGHIFGIHRADVRRLWWHCYLPFGLLHFVGAPLLIGLCFGQTAAWVFLINRVLAELVHNVHAFIVILPNHTAPDLSRFDFHYHDRHSFLVCQMMSTVNYRTGHPVGDYLQFWLNYQIEHHLFPDLPMTAYAALVPKVRAICERHGVPYHQEPLSQRLWPMAKVFIGDAQMEVVSSWSAVSTDGQRHTGSTVA